jgi:hypothetical protein
MRSSSPSQSDTLFKSTSLEDGVNTPYSDVDLKPGRVDEMDPESTSLPKKLWRKVTTTDLVEGHGVAPLQESQRTDAKFIQNFTLW